MPTYSRHNLIPVRYPFSDLSSSKVRPAAVVNGPHVSQDLIIVPITSRLTGLLPDEFVLTEWRGAGLNVPSAIKRGLYTTEGMDDCLSTRQNGVDGAVYSILPLSRCVLA